MILSMGEILTRLSVIHGGRESAGGGCAPSHAKCEALGITEYWMPILNYKQF